MSANWPEVEELRAAMIAKREREGWTQHEMADELGVSQSMVAKLETGTITRPSYGVVRKIVKALGETDIREKGGSE